MKRIPQSPTDNKYPEHDFLLSCLNLGLKYDDLKHFTYVDIMKVFLSSYKSSQKTKKEDVREATQADINNFLR